MVKSLCGRKAENQKKRVEDSTAKRKKPAEKTLLAVKLHPTQKRFHVGGTTVRAPFMTECLPLFQ
ncbi:hypothetical protein CUN67_03260 [Pantoea cypripedii]|jgi:hypothetical protein|uniref:Uncharacterized protein n=1 Tax=Pantoea cypripedii TaxID=55209 RepID=A0A6B9FZE0_PANCY|nr:hypothetical protein CUN67_03260 [Pantoea cypripedii]